MMGELVSFIVTNYNHADYLPQRLDSLLHQTYKDTEIIIVDDCSTDHSRSVYDSYGSYPNIRFKLLEKNQYYANASNIGAELSRGKYIMFAEADDFSEPGQIEILLQTLQENKTTGVAYSRSNLVDTHGKIFGSDFDSREKLFRDFCSGDVLIPRDMMQKFLLMACVVPNMSAALIEKKYFQIAGGFDPRYKSCADWDFWGRIAEHCDFYYIAQPLNNFRRHPATLDYSFGYHTQPLEIFDILYKRSSGIHLSYLERVKFRTAIGAAWSMRITQHPLRWMRYFFHVWQKGSKYDPFIIINLFLWMVKKCHEKAVHSLSLQRRRPDKNGFFGL